MGWRILVLAVVFMVIVPVVSEAGTTVYDDFSSKVISLGKWERSETGKVLDGEKLTMELRGYNHDFLGTRLFFNAPETIDSVSAEFAITFAEHYNHTSGDMLLAGIEGTFLAHGTGVEAADIIAGVYLVHDDPAASTVSVVYSLWEKNQQGKSLIQSDVLVAQVQGNSTIVLTLECDGEDNIRFSYVYNNGSTVSGSYEWTDTATAGTIHEQGKMLLVGMANPENSASGHIIATVDNVLTTSASAGAYGNPLTLYDDFSVTSFDSTRWREGERDTDGFCRRDIENDMMVLAAQHDNNGFGLFKLHSPLPEASYSSFLQADVIVETATFTGADAANNRAEAGLTAFGYNDTYATPSNGAEGVVMPMVKVVSPAGGTDQVKATLTRCSDSSCLSLSEVMSYDLGCTVTRGQPNTLSLGRRGNTITYGCDGLEYSYTITTSMYPTPDAGQYPFLFAFAGSGESTSAKSYINNVYAGGFSWHMLLPALFYRHLGEP